jgi:hypothetical protein
MRPLFSIVTGKANVTAARPVRLAPRQLHGSFRKICLLAVAVVFSLAAFPGLSNAQDKLSAGNAKGVQILLLGTKGGPPLLLDRSESSTLLIVDGRRYLIDCGIGTGYTMLINEVVQGTRSAAQEPGGLNNGPETIIFPVGCSTEFFSPVHTSPISQ